MIVLHGFGPMFGLADPSPFVVKVMVLLKMAGLPYTMKATGPMNAPKGKLPYIDDGGTLVADSQFIRDYISTKYGADFDAGYREAETAAGWAIERMVEDHLYWGVVAERWLNPTNFARGPEKFFNSLPILIRPLVKVMVKRKIAANLMGQGLGRHTLDERNLLIKKDIEALAAFLGDRPFLLGDRPCGADATIFAFVDGILCPHFDSYARQVAAGLPALVAYRDRMADRFFAPNPSA